MQSSSSGIVTKFIGKNHTENMSAIDIYAVNVEERMLSVFVIQMRCACVCEKRGICINIFFIVHNVVVHYYVFITKICESDHI